jgi:hypothetical protein
MNNTGKIMLATMNIFVSSLLAAENGDGSAPPISDEVVVQPGASKSNESASPAIEPPKSEGEPSHVTTAASPDSTPKDVGALAAENNRLLREELGRRDKDYVVKLANVGKFVEQIASLGNDVVRMIIDAGYRACALNGTKFLIQMPPWGTGKLSGLASTAAG